MKVTNFVFIKKFTRISDILSLSLPPCRSEKQLQFSLSFSLPLFFLKQKQRVEKSRLKSHALTGISTRVILAGLTEKGGRGGGLNAPLSPRRSLSLARSLFFSPPNRNTRTPLRGATSLLSGRVCTSAPEPPRFL